MLVTSPAHAAARGAPSALVHMAPICGRVFEWGDPPPMVPRGSLGGLPILIHTYTDQPLSRILCMSRKRRICSLAGAQLQETFLQFLGPACCNTNGIEHRSMNAKPSIAINLPESPGFFPRIPFFHHINHILPQHPSTTSYHNILPQHPTTTSYHNIPPITSYQPHPPSISFTEPQEALLKWLVIISASASVFGNFAAPPLIEAWGLQWRLKMALAPWPRYRRVFHGGRRTQRQTARVRNDVRMDRRTGDDRGRGSSKGLFGKRQKKGKERERERQAQRERERGTERERETERQGDRETGRQGDRETGRQRQTRHFFFVCLLGFAGKNRAVVLG